MEAALEHDSQDIGYTAPAEATSGGACEVARRGAPALRAGAWDGGEAWYSCDQAGAAELEEGEVPPLV